MVFKGNDGGSTVTALTLDMSAGGAATFNGNMTMNGIAGTSPIFELINNDNEDVNTGRETSVRFSGHRSGGEDVVNAQISGSHSGSADDDKGMLFFYTNGGSGIGERMRIDENSVILNQDGNQQFFRVESDGLTHAFFVDGENNTVGIGSSGMPVYSGNAQLSLGPMAHFMAETTSGVDRSLHISQNAHLDADGSWETMETDEASNYYQNAGTHNFRVASSTSAGTDISWINAMTIDVGGTMTLHNSAIRVPDGSAAAPSFTFGNDTNTGIYSNAGDNIAFSTGGTIRAFLSASQFNVTGNGVFSGSISKGSGSFKIDHPLPAKTDTHHLVHSFVEAPQADNIYRGSVDLVGGSATVNIDTAAGMTDGTFVLLNTNVQCFTSNESGWTAIKGSVSGNTLTITAQESSCTDTISWMVVGERHDQHMKDTEWTDSDGKVIVEPQKISEGE